MAKRNKTNLKRKKKLIVPQSSHKLTHFHIPMIVVKYSIAICFILVILMTGFFLNYRQVVSAAHANKDELEFLRKNNNEQIGKIEQLVQDTNRLQSDMERLNSLDVELRRILANDNGTSTSRAGLTRPSENYTDRGRTQIQRDINTIHSTVNDLQVAIKEREQSLIELKEELLKKQAQLAARPSIWPAVGEVTSRFGWRGAPTGRGSDYHPGIDIANRIGTPIVATANGTVIFSDWYSGYGKLVQIDHGNGIVTLYGHNSQILVHDGQVVKRGELIAYLGNTGYSTGPHVHYEIRVDGTAVNPANFLN